MAHKTTRKQKPHSPALPGHLAELEIKAAQKGVHVHYDLLEAAGLKLKGGLCKIRGEYHLFVDRRRSLAERIDILHDFLSRPLPEDVPETQDNGYQPGG